jgi:hypothetical protein
MALVVTSEHRESDAEHFTFEKTALTYEHDGAGWVEDVIDWDRLPKNDRPTLYQLDALDRLSKKQRLAERGPHGLGKTATLAWAILWFSTTRDGLARDWKTITTAGAWRQLQRYLWPEIHKWARLIRWDVLGRGPFLDGSELLDMALKLEHGEASAVASNQPMLIEGAHADAMLYVFDESKAIPDGTFDAAEGAFSGAGPGSGREALAIATSTPGPPSGRFYLIHKRARGYEDWDAVHVTLDDAIKAKRITRDWAEKRRAQWGEDSAVYRNRVLGEFASADEDAVIPMAWLEAANARWLEWKDRRVETVRARLKAIGADVSYGGADKTVVSLRDVDDVIQEVRFIAVHKLRSPTTKTSGEIARLLRELGGTAVVDVIGYGAGCVDQLRDDKLPVVAFNASVRAMLPDETPIKDRSGELGFADMRSAAWWHLRECLNPEYGSTVAIPPDEQIPGLTTDVNASLTGDLLAPRYDYISGGRIKVESKDDIKKRIGRSTDCGDTVVQAFALELFSNVKKPTHGRPIVIPNLSLWRKS